MPSFSIKIWEVILKLEKEHKMNSRDFWVTLFQERINYTKDTELGTHAYYKLAGKAFNLTDFMRDPRNAEEVEILFRWIDAELSPF